MTQHPRRYYYGPAFKPKAGGDSIRLIVFNHPCHVDGCAAQAPFGFGVNLRGGKPGLWACEQHKHLLTGERHTAPVENTGAQDEQQATGDGAGDLFGPEPGASG